MHQKKRSMRGRANRRVVRQTQEHLKTAGFDPGPVDGRFGPRTQKALRDFQGSKGLKQTGRLNRETRRALLAGTPASSQRAMRGASGPSGLVTDPRLPEPRGMEPRG